MVLKNGMKSLKQFFCFKSLFLGTFLLMITSSCSLMTKRLGSTSNEEEPQWSAAGSLVPAEIAAEIQRISGETPRNLSRKLNMKNGKPSEDGSYSVLTPQNQWTEVPTEAGKTLNALNMNDNDGAPETEIENERENQNPHSHDGRHLASKNGRTENYKVKKGDTLMKIAFEKYGNLYRWREIFEANKETLKGYNFLRAGMSLTIEGVEYIVIDKNGSPYLIKRGDTLSKISHGVYGDSHFWRELWFNNKQLIRNPDQIFYGFTLYYQPFENLKNIKRRGLAEKK